MALQLEREWTKVECLSSCEEATLGVMDNSLSLSSLLAASSPAQTVQLADKATQFIIQVDQRVNYLGLWPA